MITTDGFEIYEGVVKRLFDPACVNGQDIEQRRKNRVISIDRKLLIGTDKRLEEALQNSEDFETLPAGGKCVPEYAKKGYLSSGG